MTKTQTAPKPASRQRTPRIQPAPASLPPEANAEAAKDAQEAQDIKDRQRAKKAADKIGQVPELTDAHYSIDQSPTQCWREAVIDHFKGDVDRIPKWLFKRAYFALKIIVDTFYTQSEYDRAQVDDRRALAHKMGWKYAALGPNHRREPHPNPKERDPRFPSMVEQLAKE
jgi:hypothetical protein